MANDIITFFGILCCVWLFTKGSQPIEFIKKLFNIHNTSNSRNTFVIIIRKLVNCSLCSGFWIGLVCYWSLPMAALVAISSEIFTRLINLTLSKI